MVAIDAVEHLNRHAKKASRLPSVDTSLHQPRCGGVPQRMRCHVGAATSEARRAFESRLDRFNRLAIPLYHVEPNQTVGFPTLQMCQQTRWDGNWRVPLLGLSSALCEAIKDAIIEIDVRPAFAALDRCAGNGCGSCAGVQTK